MNWQADAFWQYSVDIYARTGVAETLITLQDNFGVNVNLCLLCSYIQRSGNVLQQTQLEELEQALVRTDKTLQPLRAERRDAKHPNPDCYKQLLAEELEWERQQQQDLIDALNRMSLDDGKQQVIEFYLSQHSSGEHVLTQDKLNSVSLLLTRE